MNKRMKKKLYRIERLETKIAQLMAENVLLTESLKNRVKAHEELERRVNVNAQATNSRFDYLEKKVADKVFKKSWFSRK